VVPYGTIPFYRLVQNLIKSEPMNGKWSGRFLYFDHRLQMENVAG
jgi:hypothetical protein